MARRLAWLLALTALGACNRVDPAGPGDGDPDVAVPEPSGLGPCEAPLDLPPDPLVRLGQLDVWPDPQGGHRTHIIDMDRDPDNGRFYAVGYGGLMVFEDTGGTPDLLASHKLGKLKEWSRVQALGAGMVAVTNRHTGLAIYDATSPPPLQVVQQRKMEDPSGMAARDQLLYLLTHLGRLTTYEIGAGFDLAVVDETEGLGNPWEMVLSGSYGYVADNTLGVVVVDLASPTAPLVAASVSAAGGAQDIDVEGDILALAVGSAGVQTFSLADPAVPVALDTLALGGTVVSVSLSGGLLWATNQEGVCVVDATLPAALVPLGCEVTDEWAMHVVAMEERAMVGDWGLMELFQVDPDVHAPSADPGADSLYLSDEIPLTTWSMANRGSAPLEIVGATVGDPRVVLEVDMTVVAPSAQAEFTLSFADDGQPLHTTFCVATNDPAQPVIEVMVSNSSEGSTLALGEVAADFLLVDLEGEPHQLSAEVGHPVVLIYFATW